MSKSKMIINFNKFQPSKVSVTDLEENKRSKGQKISYVRYGDNQPFIKSPEIQLSTYGIPRAGEYYKDDSQRSFLKVPLDVNDEKYGDDITVYHSKLTELDKLMDSDKMREHIFGSKKAAKGWVYQPLVREAMQQVLDNSDSDSDDADSKPTTAQFRPPYIKVKLKTNYETGAIETSVFKKTESGRQRAKVTTLQDLEQLVTYRSVIRMVVMPNKLWAMKNMQGKRYGLALKMTHLEVEPVSRSTLKDVYEGDVFGDSDDEGAETQKVEGTLSDDDDMDSVQSSKLNTKSLDDGLDSDDDDDSEDDSDSDSDSEEEKKVVAKKKTSKTTKKKKSSKKSATSSA